MKTRSILVLAVFVGLAMPLFGQGELAGYNAQIKRGHAEAVVGDLKKFTEANPRNIDGWLLFGEATLQTGNFEAAEEAGRKAISLNDEHPGGYIVVARALQATKRSGDAYAIIRKGLKNKKNDPRLLAQLGFLHLANDSLAQAVIEFSRAKEENPNDVSALEGLGDAYMKQKTFTMAALQYEKAVELDSLRVDIQMKLAQAYWKEASQSNIDARYFDAGRLYEKVLAVDSSNMEATLNLGRVLLIKKEFTTAARLFGNYVAKNPDNAMAWTNYLDALYKSKQYDAVVAVSDRILKTQPGSVKALRYKAVAQFVRKDYPASIAAYNALQAVDTLRKDDLQTLLRCYGETKDDSMQVVVRTQILQADPAETVQLYEIGKLHMRMKNYVRAAEMFRQHFEREPDFTNSYLNYASCMIFLKNYEPARVALRQALARTPDNVPVHLKLANTLAYMDSTREARREYETTIQLALQDTTKYRNDLGEAYGYLGVQLLIDKQYQKALDALNESIKLRSDNYLTRLWRAQTYQNLNRKDDAVREYKEVLKLDPKNKDAKKGLEMLAQ